MSEEEKDAIERLKNRQDFRYDSKCIRCGKGATIIIPTEVLYGKETDIVLNLIDKLQKGNEDLKEDSQKQWEERCRLSFEVDELQEENEELKKQLESRYYHTINIRELEKEINNSWENKIRDKINEYKENIKIFKEINRTDYISITECKILGLKELLEEE